MAIQDSQNTPNVTTIVNADDFHGLREQIIANAGVLCPQLLCGSRTYQTTGTVLPNQVFEVIVAGSTPMRALLVHGEFPTKKIAAKGPAANSAEAALQGLLGVTSEALGWYADTLLGELENAETCLSGEVDFKMVEGGFHFAASQRWAQRD